MERKEALKRTGYDAREFLKFIKRYLNPVTIGKEAERKSDAVTWGFASGILKGIAVYAALSYTTRQVWPLAFLPLLAILDTGSSVYGYNLKEIEREKKPSLIIYFLNYGLHWKKK